MYSSPTQAHFMQLTLVASKSKLISYAIYIASRPWDHRLQPFADTSADPQDKCAIHPPKSKPHPCLASNHASWLCWVQWNFNKHTACRFSVDVRSQHFVVIWHPSQLLSSVYIFGCWTLIHSLTPYKCYIAYIQEYLLQLQCCHCTFFVVFL